jgi:hypothetical protein
VVFHDGAGLHVAEHLCMAGADRIVAVHPRGAGTRRGLRLEHTVPATPAAPLLARRELAATLRATLPVYRFDDTVLAVSEVITWGYLANAHRDREQLGVTVDVTDERVRLTIEQARPRVHPSRPAPPEGKTPEPHLKLVRRIADDWGFEPGPPSRIWFDVRR